MENEIWKEIPEYKGLYEVSNYGQIKSIERLEKCGNKTRIRKARILKQSLRRGYLFVSLCKNGRKERKRSITEIAGGFMKRKKSEIYKEKALQGKVEIEKLLDK